MDSLAALALGTETPTPDLLDRKPYGSKEKLISPIMARNITIQAAFQVAILLTLLYAGPEIFNLPYTLDPGSSFVPPNKFTLDTMIFNTFVFLQVFNEFNARSVTNGLNSFQGVFTNYIFVGITIITAVLQVLIVEFGGGFMDTKPLTLPQWGVCVLLGLLSIPLGFIQRMVPVDGIFNRRGGNKEGEKQPLIDGSSSHL